MELNDEYFFNEAQRVAKVGTFIYDIKSDISINSNVLNQILGLEDDYQMNFEGWINTVHPSQKNEMEAYFRKVITSGIDFNKEYMIINQIDGTEIWVVEKAKMYFDESGIPDKYAGTIQDITELKKKEEGYKRLYEEYEQKESLLVSILNSIPHMIYYKDTHGTYLGCNKAFEKFAGMKEEDITGKNDYEIFENKIAEFCRTTDFNTMENMETSINEEWVKYPNGKRVLLESLKTPYYDSKGNSLGIIGVSRDITEKIEKEELQRNIEDEKRSLNEIKEHNKLKTEFFANISHELRTPVNVIFSAVQMEEVMLKDYLAGKKGSIKLKYVNMMKQNCYRLIRLINNLIDITKIDTNYFSIHKINDDIISLVENITLSVAAYIENKGISITFDTDIEEKTIACDPEKIERIMLNLLSNAVKFTPEGGSIFVNIEDGTDEICIKVKDNGAGIPEDKLNSIFERFVQVDKSFTRTHEGSGIGLSLVKALVELHGGTISVTSKEGKGTEFIIRIPCKLVEDDLSICDAQIERSNIEKINIEFSDIYN